MKSPTTMSSAPKRRNADPGFDFSRPSRRAKKTMKAKMEVRRRNEIDAVDSVLMKSFKKSIERLRFAPHPPFGHVLPARGEKGNNACRLPSPRLAGRGWPKAG